MSRLPSVSDALELLVPAEEEPRAWGEVLRRSGHTRRRARPLVLAFAVLALALVGVAASATGTLDRFGGWVTGQFGEPAPPSAQEGFEERNRQAFARFPEGTQLRRLLGRTVAGVDYELFGFRHGPWWCLRLVRADKPAGAGVNECVASSQLANGDAPAIVFAGPLFGIRGMHVDGAFGLAASDVRELEVVRPRSGTSRVPIENNAFLILQAQRAGTVANHPPSDPAVRLYAIGADGSRTLVPMVGALPEQPQGPSYFDHRTPSASELPGPTRPEVAVSREIEWIERREPRGEPFDVQNLGPFGANRPAEAPFGEIVSARALQPDRSAPNRVVVAFTRDGGVCTTQIAELTSRPAGLGCVGRVSRVLTPFGQNFFLDAYGPRGPHFTRVTGFASDGVASVSLFLADGSRVEAALRDNVYTVEAPFGEFPAKLVAYDRNGRVAAVEVLPGPGKLTPCPRAPARDAIAAARPYERIDLGALTINGVAIVGSRPAEVLARVGRPDRIEKDGPRRQTFVYGAEGRRDDRGVRISFGYAHGRFHGAALSVFSQNAVDPQLGRFLRLPPERLQRALAEAYPSRYRLEYGYGAEPGRGCVAAFKRLPRSERVTISFGLSPFPRGLGDRPFLFLSRP